jgi:hypothetical protein
MKDKGNVDGWIKRMVAFFLMITFLISVSILIIARFGLDYGFHNETSEVEKQTEIITKQSSWSFMDGGEEPGVGNVWTKEVYDASTWKKGVGSFGTEKIKQAYDVKAENLLKYHKFQKNKAATYFFRMEFTLDSLQDIAALEGEMMYSNAAIIYLNGTVIFAGNVPQGGYTNNQQAGTTESFRQVQDKNFVITDLDALQEGNNVLALEVHSELEEKADAFFV